MINDPGIRTLYSHPLCFSVVFFANFQFNLLNIVPLSVSLRIKIIDYSVTIRELEAPRCRVVGLGSYSITFMFT